MTSSPARPLTKEAIQAHLSTERFGRTLHLFRETASTNHDALRLAQQGSPDGTVVVAESQTAGKGRLGRSWHSPPGDNLYCSVILRPGPGGEQSGWLPLIPLVSAVAVAKALQHVTGLLPSLKWPNDILLGDRKLGGLLCESSLAGPSAAFVVVGIGLNVNGSRRDFPDDLRGIATSVAAETGKPCDLALLVASILAELERCADALRTGSAEAALRDYVRLCSTLGRRVRVTLSENRILEGRADSIAADGSLLVAHDPASGGGLVEVRAGDVVHLRNGREA